MKRLKSKIKKNHFEIYSFTSQNPVVTPQNLESSEHITRFSSEFNMWMEGGSLKVVRYL